MNIHSITKNNTGPLLSTLFLILFLPVAVSYHHIQHGHAEYYIRYFVFAAFFVSLPPFMLAEKWKTSITQAVALIALVLFLTYAYWSYRDKPYVLNYQYWTEKSAFNARYNSAACDGPCFGWFSFENELKYTPLLEAGLVGLVVGGVTRVGVAKVLKKKSSNDIS